MSIVGTHYQERYCFCTVHTKQTGNQNQERENRNNYALNGQFRHHPSASGCNTVKSGGPASISRHNPQQFHGWNRTESGGMIHGVATLPFTTAASRPLLLLLMDR
jgi:hypothetical protein